LGGGSPVIVPDNGCTISAEEPGAGAGIRGDGEID